MSLWKFHFKNIYVNYPGTSLGGIRWKQIFNFKASLGVLYPLAVPIKKGKINLPFLFQLFTINLIL